MLTPLLHRLRAYLPWEPSRFPEATPEGSITNKQEEMDARKRLRWDFFILI